MNFEVLRHKYYKRYLEMVGGREKRKKKKGFLFHLRKQQHTQTHKSGEISLLDNFNYLSCAGMDEKTSIRFQWDKRRK